VSANGRLASQVGKQHGKMAVAQVDTALFSSQRPDFVPLHSQQNETSMGTTDIPRANDNEMRFATAQ